MRVDRIEVRDFMNHGDTVIELPPAGVVVVTGDNGSGKSAISEAVAWACWGKTIRGSSPVPPRGEKTIRVELETPELTITRDKKAGKVKWNATKYETNTKAQLALEGVIGEFETWKRTHFFSSEAVGFARGRDAERKRLLEQLLGIEKYETAYRSCLADLRAAQKDLADLRHRANLTESKVDGLMARIEDAEEFLDTFSEPEPLDPDALARVTDRIKAINEIKSGLAVELREARQDLARAEAMAAASAKHIERLAADNCPTCDQPIPDELRTQLTEEFAAVRAEVTRAKLEAKERNEHARDVEDELADEMEELRSERHRITAAKAAASKETRTLATVEDTIERCERELLAAEDTLDELVADVEDAQHRTDVLSTVAQVLGTKGFRAQVLGDALAGVEHAANNVLDHLTGGTIRIQLNSYSTTATGKVVDSISLGVIGAGGDQGYKACSTGQRRRVDVAIVLALAKLAGARGTLWFDEVFDGLDPSGVDRLADLLGDLAVDRSVVVITHNHDFGKKVRATERWTVADGVVT